MATVPREFIGMARALIGRVAAEDALIDGKLDVIEKLLRERLKRKPTLRPEHVMEIERLWAQLPATYRLAGPTYERPKKRILIREIRLNAGTTMCDDWQHDEPNLSVSWVKLESSGKGGYVIHMLPAVGISLHALARCFQRRRDRTEAAVLADIAPLIDVGTWAKAGIDVTRIPVSGGRWLGEVSKTDMLDKNGRGITERNALSIRTFFDNDMLEGLPEDERDLETLMAEGD